MNTKQMTEKAKQMYFVSDFKTFMRGNVMGLTDEDLEKPVPRIRQLILESREKDPMKIFYGLMDQIEKEWTASVPVPVNSDWHHFIVPGIVLAAMRNSGHEIGIRDIEEGMRRGERLQGGSCGFSGTCGGAYSVGIVASIVTKTTPLHDEERSEIMNVVADTLRRISEHERRCCKRSSFVAIECAVDYLNEKGYRLPLSQIPCEFSTRNKMCLGRKCPYHRRCVNRSGGDRQ